MGIMPSDQTYTENDDKSIYCSCAEETRGSNESLDSVSSSIKQARAHSLHRPRGQHQVRVDLLYAVVISNTNTNDSSNIIRWAVISAKA